MLSFGLLRVVRTVGKHLLVRTVGKCWPSSGGSSFVSQELFVEEIGSSNSRTCRITSF
ncbi:hypothetical protein YC2023_098857 [Brassica napus]